MERLEDLRLEVAARPEDPIAWCRFAIGLAESGDAARAKEAIRRAQAVAPDDARVWLAIGRAAEQVHDLPGALVSYQRATRLDRGNREAYRALGAALLARGDATAAALTLRVALALGEEPATHALLATALSSAGKHEEAIAHARRALELAPDDVVLSRHLARTLERAGRTEESVLALRKVVEIDPKDVEASVDLAAKLADAGDSALAKVEVAKILASSVRSPELDVKLGAILLASGDVARALQLLREAARQRPNLPEAHYHLGRAQEATGLREEALRSLRVAVHLAPNWVPALHALGRACQRAGELREAASALVRAAALSPDDTDVQDALGEVMAARSSERSGSMPPARSPSESISGDLAILALNDMLELLSNQGATGALVLTSEERKGQVDLIAGRVLRVVSPSRRTLAAILEEKGVLSRAALEAALGGVDASDDDKVAETLLVGGLIDRAQYAAALRAQSRGALAELLGWRTGVLRFYAETAFPYPEDLALDARALLDEARRAPVP